MRLSKPHTNDHGSVIASFSRDFSTFEYSETIFEIIRRRYIDVSRNMIGHRQRVGIDQYPLMVRASGEIAVERTCHFVKITARFLNSALAEYAERKSA